MFDYLFVASGMFKGGGAGTGLVFLISLIVLVWFVIAIAGLWKMFQKAGKPGWGAIVPFYNLYLLIEIVGRPGWWFVLLFVPGVNLIIEIILAMDLAKSFGKSGLWGIIFFLLLGGLGYILLGFGSAEYVGPAAAQGQA